MKDLKSAIVEDRKLVEYLLNLSHPVGAPKARFFRSHGFSDANVEQLRDGLLAIARTAETSAHETEHGVKYVATGELLTPSGTVVNLVTVWIVEPTDPRPRLVTAYPA